MSFEYTFLEKEKGRSACIVFSQCAFYRKGGTSMPVLNRVAQAAEIQAAKHNWELIPMCHPLPLTGIDITFHLSDEPCMVEIQAAVTCTGVTGVEMEALTAVSVAALTIYDMCKAVQKDMEITNIRLLEKSGGKSGDYKRED